MDHHSPLLVTDKGIRPYIEKLIYGVALFMPLEPLVGDILLWSAIVLSLYDQGRQHLIKRPTGWLSCTVVAYVLWVGVSSVISEHRDWSLVGWLYQVVACGGIYYLMRTYMSEYWQWRIFLQFFLGSALLVCVIGVYQYVFVPNVHMHEWVDAKQFPKLMRRMSSTLQNPNLLGAYLLMVLSVAGSYVLTYFKAKRYEEVYKILPVAIVVFLVMLLTYSRGIWVSFAAMVLYWGIVVERRLLWSLLGIPIVLYFYQGEIAGRLWSLFHGQDTSVALRWALWDSTTYIIAEHPIFGIGWNTFWLVYPDYNYFIQAPVILMYHAHNLYLNMLAEIGIPGFILFMTVIIGHAVAALRLDGDGFRKSAQIGMGTLVVAMLVSGLSDFELYSHQVAVVFWQLLGWVGAFMKVNEKSHK